MLQDYNILRSELMAPGANRGARPRLKGVALLKGEGTGRIFAKQAPPIGGHPQIVSWER
jgi:hypothetical protein